MRGLKEMRIKAGFTQEELAKKIGVSLGMVSKWENGKQTPKYLNITKLKRALKCSYDDLMSD